mgnify:CR=1 FL=1
MNPITLSLTETQSGLVQELLQKVLEEQEAIIQSSVSSDDDVKRAKFRTECVKYLLQALQQGYTSINMPDQIMKTALSQLKPMLEKHMAIMMDLMKDNSLEQDNLIQVFERGIGLLHVMQRMTTEALHTEKSTA